VDDALEHDQQLLRVTVRVRLVAGRTARVELSAHHLQVLERPRREHVLPPEGAEGQRGPALAPEDARTARLAVRLEQVGHADAQCGRNPRQRCNARVRTSALDLAQEALGETGAICDRPQRHPPERPDRPEALADVDVVVFSALRGHRRKLKRHYSSL
jgi:hypothetical protein